MKCLMKAFQMILLAFVFRVFCKLGGLKVIAHALSVAVNPKGAGPAIQTPSLQKSSNGQANNPKNDQPKMFQNPNLLWFGPKEVGMEELKIRAEIFDISDIPNVQGKVFTFRNLGYWWEV